MTMDQVTTETDDKNRRIVSLARKALESVRIELEETERDLRGAVSVLNIESIERDLFMYQKQLADVAALLNRFDG